MQAVARIAVLKSSRIVVISSHSKEIYDDTMLYEGYFNGYNRESIVTSFSMAKSFTSALIGIAIDEGYIGGVNDPVITYLPELRGRGLDGLTIRHLLTMSSGIRYIHDDAVSPSAGVVVVRFGTDMGGVDAWEDVFAVLIARVR